MRYKGIVLAVIFLSGFLTIYFLSKGDSPVKRGLYAGDAAPAFEAKDTEGNLWRLGDLKGKVVVINFWATWCDTCKMEKPFFNQLYESLKDQGDIVFLTMLYNDDIQSGREYMQKHSYRFPLLEDRHGIAAQYGLRAVPETFVIDKKGNLAQKIVGPMKWDAEDVRAAMLRLMKS